MSSLSRRGFFRGLAVAAMAAASRIYPVAPKPELEAEALRPEDATWSACTGETVVRCIVIFDDITGEVVADWWEMPGDGA